MSGLGEQLRIERRLPSRTLARAIRVDAGVSQRRLAQAVGVHPVTVARWELGVQRPRGPKLQAYVDVLDELKAL